MPPELLIGFLLVFGLAPPAIDLPDDLSPAADTVAPPVAQSPEASSPAITIVTYPDMPRLIQHSGPALSDVALRAWETEFLGTSFFSAFAVSKNGGYGYATTANTPEAARDIALRQCETVNTGCRVIAEIHPEGYATPAAGALTISVEIAGYYAEAEGYAPHRAMAISADGAYSLVWGYDTQAQADEVALGDCEGYRMRDLPGLSDYPCVIVPGLN